jgi:hypothetical protein
MLSVFFHLLLFMINASHAQAVIFSAAVLVFVLLRFISFLVGGGEGSRLFAIDLFHFTFSYIAEVFTLTSLHLSFHVHVFNSLF